MVVEPADGEAVVVVGAPPPLEVPLGEEELLTEQLNGPHRQVCNIIFMHILSLHIYIVILLSIRFTIIVLYISIA